MKSQAELVRIASEHISEMLKDGIVVEYVGIPIQFPMSFFDSEDKPLCVPILQMHSVHNGQVLKAPVPVEGMPECKGI